jgi:hypothetical protein
MAGRHSSKGGVVEDTEVMEGILRQIRVQDGEALFVRVQQLK